MGKHKVKIVLIEDDLALGSLILELLIMRKGVVQTKETFLNHLYGGLDEPEIKIIDVFICKLRKKLSEYNMSHIIVTVWGRGYVINEINNLSLNKNVTAQVPLAQAT